MKVHVIYADVGTYYYPNLHHGVASIIAVLRDHDIEVSLHHVKKIPTWHEINDRIAKEKPNLIAFSATTNQIHYVKEWSTWVRQRFTTPTICGGVHATLCPEEVINYEGIDVVCIGEGEFALLDLCRMMQCHEVHPIDGLWIKNHCGIIKGKPRYLIANLDCLPYPDYSLFRPENILKDRKGAFTVMASRGCPFACHNCCNSALRKPYNGQKYFRVRSVDNVIDQLKKLKERYKIKRFDFADDVLGLNKEWTREFCSKYKELDTPFTCNARADVVTEQIMEWLKSAGCSEISMGVESGNEWIRVNVLNRRMTNDQIIKAFESAHKLGIKTLSYNMIGLPYETSEMIQETIDLNKIIQPDRLGIFYFYPFPGTELYDLCLKEGFISENKTDSYLTDTILDLNTISREELDRKYIEFYRYAISRQFPMYRYLDPVCGRFLNKKTLQFGMQSYLRLSHFIGG